MLGRSILLTSQKHVQKPLFVRDDVPNRLRTDDTEVKDVALANELLVTVGRPKIQKYRN